MAEFRRTNSFVRSSVRSFVRSAEISAENLNCLLDLYDDSCEPQFFTYVFFGGKFRRNFRKISAENSNYLLLCTTIRANLDFLHMFFRRKISAEFSEKFGGKFELFAALYDDSCEPQFFTYVFLAEFLGNCLRKNRIFAWIFARIFARIFRNSHGFLHGFLQGFSYGFSHGFLIFNGIGIEVGMA